MVRTLVYFDEPQLIEMDAGKSKVVAVRVPDEKGEFPFLASVVSPREWERYRRGMVDLLYMFTYSARHFLFTFDLINMTKDGSVMMKPIESGDVPPEWMPERQFFSRDHTELDDQESGASLGRQEFAIDGEWALRDFGHFYSKFSDIYAFEMTIDKVLDKRTPDTKRKAIQQAFRHYPFRGGSSYGGFYNDLAGVLSLEEQPGVDGVRYESPGYVAIRGYQHIFDRVYNSIQLYRSEFIEIKSAYKKLYTHLSALGYLKASRKDFDNSDLASTSILTEAENLARLLGMADIDLIKQLCDGNTLVFAKVVLSYSRRVEGAFDFFAEGRASFREDIA